MTPAATFPAGSVRAAVARWGDNWPLAFEDPASQASNEHFGAEIRDGWIMERCTFTPHRGTELDPRVWIGVPWLERSA